MLRGREGKDASYIYKNRSRGSRLRDSRSLLNSLLYTSGDNLCLPLSTKPRQKLAQLKHILLASQAAGSLHITPKETRTKTATAASKATATRRLNSQSLVPKDYQISSSLFPSFVPLSAICTALYLLSLANGRAPKQQGSCSLPRNPKTKAQFAIVVQIVSANSKVVVKPGTVIPVRMPKA